MLTEDDIINILVEYLGEKGYIIQQSLNTNQQGIDVIALKDKKILYIEAKGETSSKPSSKRYGLPFTRNQVRTHVSVAIITSMKQLDKSSKNTNEIVCMAFPDNTHHREQIQAIRTSIQKLGIKVFWVSINGVIEA